MPAYHYYHEMRRTEMFTEIAAFIVICEDDAHHIPVLLAEIERLKMPFGIHFDRCSDETKAKVRTHPWIIAEHSHDKNEEYTEQHKQFIFDKLCKLNRFKWLIHWDADEVWEKDAPAKLVEIAKRNEAHADTQWINCWGDMQHIRIDGPFNSKRVKLYNVSHGKRWRFDHPMIYGCKLLDRSGVPFPKEMSSRFSTDLICIHHGLMTRELRERHKERWDRVYGKIAGKNPYGIWMMSCDEVNYPPTITENPYI